MTSERSLTDAELAALREEMWDAVYLLREDHASGAIDRTIDRVLAVPKLRAALALRQAVQDERMITNEGDIMAKDGDVYCEGYNALLARLRAVMEQEGT